MYVYQLIQVCMFVCKPGSSFSCACCLPMYISQNTFEIPDKHCLYLYKHIGNPKDV